MRAVGVSERIEGLQAGREVAGSGWAGGFVRELVAPLLKRLGMLGRARHATRLEVLETLALGGRRQVFLIACGGERYLVGAGVDGVGAMLRVAGADASGAAAACESGGVR